MKTRTLPNYVILHGGGLWPWMKDQMGGSDDRLEGVLRDMPRQLNSTPKVPWPGP